jgi:hypothetical protein
MASSPTVTICPPAAFRHSREDRTKKRQSRPGLIRRTLEALMAARQRKIDREIAIWIARRGGKFTDSVERELEQWLLGR